MTNDSQGKRSPVVDVGEAGRTGTWTPADVDVHTVTPLAWRLLRTAAEYEQRTVEKKLAEVKQAHVSMLENDTRSLSSDRLQQLYGLYTAELLPDQVFAIVDNF